MLFADSYNNRIRKVTVSTNVITTIVGTGTQSYSGDGGAATSATLKYPFAITLDSSGNYYIADGNNQCIRKVTVSTGIISTIAGSGTQGYSGDGGPATSASLNSPWGVAVDPSGLFTRYSLVYMFSLLQYIGDVYIAEFGNNRIRKVVISTGLIYTYAGTGTSGYGGDNGPATSAKFYFPVSVAVDASGVVFVADYNNNRIRKIFSATNSPTPMPSYTPSLKPSSVPSTATPTVTPTRNPTSLPSTGQPSIRPTITPTMTPSICPTMNPTTIPSSTPSQQPTALPSTTVPTVTPTTTPSICPTMTPTTIPSYAPSEEPTVAPTTEVPTITPTIMPTYAPSQEPTSIPSTSEPSLAPTMIPTYTPSQEPTSIPSTREPSQAPSVYPSATDSPTSSPTSQPTQVDLIAVNFMSVVVTSEEVKQKTQFYLGSYVAYFLCIYISLYLYSCTNYGIQTSKMLYNSSFNSHYFDVVSRKEPSKCLELQQIYQKNEILQQIARAVSASTRRIEAASDSFTKVYREYVQQQRTLLGCDACMYPKGITQTLTYFQPIILPPGRIEDIILFICHNHPFFSCFYFIEGSQLGAHGHRILFISRDIVVFSGYQFSNMLLEYLSLDHYGLGVAISLFIITPLAISVHLLLKYLYICPCIDEDSLLGSYKTHLKCMGKLAIIPLIVVMGIALVFACLFSNGRRVDKVLINYFFFVQIYGIFFLLIKAVLLFKDRYFLQISILGKMQIITVGNLYRERIIAEQMNENIDFACRTDRYLGGMLIVQRIYNREDAIKANWIQGTNEDTTTNPHHSNPLHNGSMGERGSEYDERVSYGDVYRTQTFNEGIEMHSTFSSTTSYHSAFQSLRNLMSPTASSNDDAALYLEYQQQQQENPSSNDYSLDSNLSFEEWKIKRKQFKKGTRNSFISAFQVFEEREQQQQGVASTMLMHSNSMRINK